jgi:hypothetical protein
VPRADLAILFDDSETVIDESSQSGYRLVAIINNAEESDTQWMDSAAERLASKVLTKDSLPSGSGQSTMLL